MLMIPLELTTRSGKPKGTVKGAKYLSMGYWCSLRLGRRLSKFDSYYSDHLKKIKSP